ncbi:MAG: type II toxin-antitoxin system VapC family toxin [Bacteroidota bacterium]
MKYLLDTHYLIWALTDTKKISKKIVNLITDPENEIVVSAISFWEISLKSSLGKLRITGFSPEDLPSACLQMGFTIIPISAEDASKYHHLSASHHRDPFDRMLIWQAINNSYTLISADKTIRKYINEGLLIYS